jgi:hypothetical protein
MNSNKNCAICDKKLNFWNQPTSGKGSLKSGEKVCFKCFFKISMIDPKRTSNFKTISLEEALNLLKRKESEKGNPHIQTNTANIKKEGLLEKQKITEKQNKPETISITELVNTVENTTDLRSLENKAEKYSERHL